MNLEIKNTSDKIENFNCKFFKIWTWFAGGLLFFTRTLNRGNFWHLEVKRPGHLGDPVGSIFSKLLRDHHLYGFILEYPSSKNTVFHGTTANTMSTLKTLGTVRNGRKTKWSGHQRTVYWGRNFVISQIFLINWKSSSDLQNFVFLITWKLKIFKVYPTA